MTAATPLTQVYDVSGTLGGPIRKDRAWYFVNGHSGGSTRESANVYYNLNAGTRAWLYAPDPSRREYSDRTFENAQRARDLAGDAAQQAHRILGRTGGLPPCTGATAGATNPRGSRPKPSASWAERCTCPGEVVVTGDGSAACSKPGTAARSSAWATSNVSRIRRAI